ncbi:MAG: SH3 domain-containing protein [Candidatus Amoebophilus sp.]
MHKLTHILLYNILALYCYGCSATNSIKLTKTLLTSTPQDCTHFLSPIKHGDELVVPYAPEKVMASFLRYYFSPWEQPFISFSLNQLCESQKKKINQLLQNPGWGLNRHPNSTNFIEEIRKNMDVDNFSNFQHPAIVLHGTNLRSIPSDKPSFSCPFADGEGYPFDNWQESYLTPNEPLYLLHTTQDGAWYLALTGSHTFGWVQRQDVALVTPAFIAEWRTGKYVTPLQDNIPVKDSSTAPLARVGQLMPLTKEQTSQNSYQVLRVATDAQGYAIIKIAAVSKQEINLMPLLATPNNMARLANNLIGQPYSWGGLQGYRDCSALLKDLLMPFGIWMPRDSGPQSKAGKRISIEGLKNEQKQALIVGQGIPFFSLLWMPGHIVLYIGAQEGKTYVYNDIWGLRTGEKTRAIIGRTAIMSADLGKQYSNIEATLLDRFKSLINLENRLTKPDDDLELFKAQ